MLGSDDSENDRRLAFQIQDVQDTNRSFVHRTIDNLPQLTHRGRRSAAVQHHNHYFDCSANAVNGRPGSAVL
jgi:hypothetical protein